MDLVRRKNHYAIKMYLKGKKEDKKEKKIE